MVRINLISKDSKERGDANALRKRIENFNFIVCMIIWEQVLTALYRVSQKLKKLSIDLSASVRLLSVAQDELKYFRNSWESVLMTASFMSSTWGIQPLFAETRLRKTKRFYDELSTDSRLVDPIRAFQVEVFHKLVDIAIN